MVLQFGFIKAELGMGQLVLTNFDPGSIFMTTKIQYFRTISFLVLFFSSVSVFPQVPSTLNYQGFLTDHTGQPISGSKQIVFSLYNSPATDTHFWREAMNVTLVEGRFSVVFGSVPNNPLEPENFTGETFIGIQVDQDTEMPRQKFTSVAYAFNADSADSATRADSSSSATTAKRIDFTGGEGPFCIFANACPTGYTGQDLAGFLIQPDGNCPYRRGATHNVEGWRWCHPRLCCVD
jgi:hypothetical protein